MELEFIAAWGEFLGGVAGVVAAFGVIATLLYLTRQIRQNTVQIRAQVAHGIMTALRSQADPIKGSTEIAELYYKGLSGIETLSDVQQFQFNAINGGFFRVFEEAYLHYKEGRLEDAYWNALSGQLREVLGVTGIRENWERMMADDDEIKGARDNFDQEFIRYGNALLNQPKFGGKTL
jgi:hypothetical protein